MAIELSEKIRFYGKEALEGRLNVATIAERNAIPLGERYNGMIVTVRAEGKRYELLYDGNFEELSESAKDAFLGNNDNWAEGNSGEGIEDVIAGTNISIDKTDPKNPVINASGEVYLDKATQAQAEAGTDDAAYMTALKVLQSLVQRIGFGLSWDNSNKKINLGGWSENRSFSLGTFVNDSERPDASEEWGININRIEGTTESQSVKIQYYYDDLWDSGEKFQHEVGVDKFGVILATDNRFLIYLNDRHPGGASGFPNYSALIVDNRGIKKGLEYYADYSASMTARSLVDKGYVDNRIDNIASGIGNGLFPPVQNLPALKAIDTTNAETHPDKWLIHVEDAGLYRLDRQSTDIDDGNSVIQPTTGVGRWLKMSSAITAHEMLTGIQGGTVGQHYHLTAAEYLIVAATELAFTNAIKAEIEEKITMDDLPSADLVRDEISIVGGLLDMTNIDIGDLTLTENTVISTIEGFQEGSKMINLIPNGYTLTWHSSIINPLNIEGELSTTEDSLILILCTSSDPLRLKIKNESNPGPIEPKIDVVLNHGNINSTGEPWSNLVYLSTAGALTTGLHNYDMSPSPVEVKINDEFSINVANNKNSGLSGDVPNTMIKSCFTNSHTHFGRLIYILNLDDQKTYTISMILCNDTVGAKTDISINGGATQTYDTFELTTWVEIGSFSPTDGIISIGFAKNPESTQDAYLCVTRITEDD